MELMSWSSEPGLSKLSWASIQRSVSATRNQLLPGELAGRMAVTSRDHPL